MLSFEAMRKLLCLSGEKNASSTFLFIYEHVFLFIPESATAKL